MAQHRTASYRTTEPHRSAQHCTIQRSTAEHTTTPHSTEQHRTAPGSGRQYMTELQSTAHYRTAHHRIAQHRTAPHNTASHNLQHVPEPHIITHRSTPRPAQATGEHRARVARSVYCPARSTMCLLLLGLLGGLLARVACSKCLLEVLTRSVYSKCLHTVFLDVFAWTTRKSQSAFSPAVPNQGN